MRLSTIKCYHQIKEEGLLSKMRMIAYEALVAYGPATAGELNAAILKEGRFKMVKANLTSRLAELRHLGVATEMPEMKECLVSGRSCLVWDVVDALPANAIKRVPSSQKIKDLEAVNSVLRAENENLRAENMRLKGKPQLSLF